MKQIDMKAIMEEAKDPKYLDLVDGNTQKYHALVKTTISFIEEVLVTDSVDPLSAYKDDILQENHLVGKSEEELFYNAFILCKNILDSDKAVAILGELFKNNFETKCETKKELTELLTVYVLYHVVGTLVEEDGE